MGTQRAIEWEDARRVEREGLLMDEESVMMSRKHMTRQSRHSTNRRSRANSDYNRSPKHGAQYY